LAATEPQRLALHAAARTALGAEEGDTLMALTPPANTDIATLQALERTEERLGTRIDTVEERLGARIGAVGQRLDARIDTVEERLGARIGAVEERLDARIGAVEERLGARIDTVEERLGARIDTVELRSRIWTFVTVLAVQGAATGYLTLALR